MKLSTLPADYPLPEVGPRARVHRSGEPDPEGRKILRDAQTKRTAAWNKIKPPEPDDGHETPDTNPLPPLDDATDAALRDSIQRYGVLVPIVCDVDGNLIDGHHRLRILKELRVTHDEDGPFHDPPSVIIVAPEGWREAYPPSGTRVQCQMAGRASAVALATRPGSWHSRSLAQPNHHS